MKNYRQQLLRGSMTECCIHIREAIIKEFMDRDPLFRLEEGFDTQPYGHEKNGACTMYYKVSSDRKPVLSVEITEPYEHDPEAFVESHDSRGDAVYIRLSSLFERYSISRRKH